MATVSKGFSGVGEVSTNSIFPNVRLSASLSLGKPQLSTGLVKFQWVLLILVKFTQCFVKCSAF